MKPVSLRIAGTLAQLNPVRSARLTRPRFAAPVARSTFLWTMAAASLLSGRMSSVQPLCQAGYRVETPWRLLSVDPSA